MRDAGGGMIEVVDVVEVVGGNVVGGYFAEVLAGGVA